MDNEFRELTVRGLESIARNRGLRGYSRLRRAELLNLLREPAPIAELTGPTVRELRIMAKLRGLRGYSRFRRGQLIWFLSNAGDRILDRGIEENIQGISILTPTPYVPSPPHQTPPPHRITPPSTTAEDLINYLHSVKKVPKNIHGISYAPRIQELEIKELKKKVDDRYKTIYESIFKVRLTENLPKPTLYLVWE